MACRASCVPLPLTHPDEHPWVSGCTALPTHPRSRSSSRQEGVGQSPPFSTPTAPIWFGESRVRGAKYLPRIWLSCSCCCGRGTPGGIGGTGLPICPWLHWLSHSCKVVSARATPGLEFPPGLEAPQGLGVVLLSGCQVVSVVSSPRQNLSGHCLVCGPAAVQPAGTSSQQRGVCVSQPDV